VTASGCPYSLKGIKCTANDSRGRPAALFVRLAADFLSLMVRDTLEVAQWKLEFTDILEGREAKAADGLKEKELTRESLAASEPRRCGSLDSGRICI